MVKYEIKKVFAKNSSKIAILLLLAVCLVTGWFAMSTAYVNEAGESEKGPAAVRKLRTEKEAWSGVL
ncbi:MAG TPA: ABC transporter permease, partial [Lachnospiraceae bacterium]|nr:ABC transporter permease [Lachnospiraceae bacterium]